MTRPRSLRLRSTVVVLFAVVAPANARAVLPTAPPTSDSEVESELCHENFPEGADRPKITEAFPARGKSGYALTLDVVAELRKGEALLPSGLGTKTNGEDQRTLERAGFFLPNPNGGTGPKLETKPKGDKVESHLTLAFVALPPKPGRAELELPSLPIAISRASGEVRTLCTKPHHVTIEDPTANTPSAKPKGNPKPVRQTEEWTAAKHAAFGALVAFAVAAAAFALFRWWRRRPKPVPPPPPPRPPWEVALEELFDVRVAELVAQGRFAEHFDRVSDAVRRYLGARYGFDGLETTTHEALLALRRAMPTSAVLVEIEGFLRNADLVKFAKLVPSEPECHAALGEAEGIVRRTMPAMASMRTIDGGPSAPGAPGSEARP